MYLFLFPYLCQLQHSRRRSTTHQLRQHQLFLRQHLLLASTITPTSMKPRYQMADEEAGGDFWISRKSSCVTAAMLVAAAEQAALALQATALILLAAAVCRAAAVTALQLVQTLGGTVALLGCQSRSNNLAVLHSSSSSSMRCTQVDSSCCCSPAYSSTSSRRCKSSSSGRGLQDSKQMQC